MKGFHTEKYGQYGGHNQVETYENSPYEEARIQGRWKNRRTVVCNIL